MSVDNSSQTTFDASKVPEQCPGTSNEQSGKASACAGCPNQRICASGEANKVDPDLARIKKRLSGVKHKILILSGKGGVGKSTVSCTLARGLASIDDDDDNDEVTQVGLLDIDICGPSVPKIMGVEGSSIHTSNLGWEPVYVEDNLGMMSIGFLLGSPDDAVIWRGPKKNGLIKQFLRDVYWNELDYLLIDTPPGTSDEHLSIAQYLKESGITGALVVTTPQEVALMDVRKEINFCKKLSIPIIGVVENMADFVCPNCAKTSQVFTPSSGGAQAMAKQMDVPFITSIPLDPRLARACDEGEDFLKEYPDTPATHQYHKVIQTLVEFCNKK